MPASAVVCFASSEGVYGVDNGGGSESTGGCMMVLGSSVVESLDLGTGGSGAVDWAEKKYTAGIAKRAGSRR